MLFLILSISSLETTQGPLGRPENPLFSENNHVTEAKQRGLYNSLQVDFKTISAPKTDNKRSKILKNFNWMQNIIQWLNN